MKQYTFFDGGYCVVYNPRDQTYSLWSLADLSTFGLPQYAIICSTDEVQIYKKLEVLSVRPIPERFFSSYTFAHYISNILS